MHASVRNRTAGARRPLAAVRRCGSSPLFHSTVRGAARLLPAVVSGRRSPAPRSHRPLLVASAEPKRRAHASATSQRVVVVGNGMVGLNFVEKLCKADIDGTYQIITFAEESRPAYHRMK